MAIKHSPYANSCLEISLPFVKYQAPGSATILRTDGDFQPTRVPHRGSMSLVPSIFLASSTRWNVGAVRGSTMTIGGELVCTVERDAGHGFAVICLKEHMYDIDDISARYSDTHVSVRHSDCLSQPQLICGCNVSQASSECPVRPIDSIVIMKLARLAITNLDCDRAVGYPS